MKNKMKKIDRKKNQNQKMEQKQKYFYLDRTKTKKLRKLEYRQFAFHDVIMVTSSSKKRMSE